MEYDTSLADAAYSLSSRWASSRFASPAELAERFSKADLELFSATQVVLFLETLEEEDAFEREKGSHVVEGLEKAYGFEANKNPEIRVRLISLSQCVLQGERRRVDESVADPPSPPSPPPPSSLARSFAGTSSRSRRVSTRRRPPHGSRSGAA